MDIIYSNILTKPNSMVLVFDTSKTSSLTATIFPKGTLSISVYWGDGTSDDYTTAGLKTHTYSTSGIYTVEISGSMTEYGYSGTLSGSGLSGAQNLTSVTSFGDLGITSLSYGFYRCSNLTSVPNTLPSTITNTYATFASASKFNQDISNWNVSNVTNMNGMFSNATEFNQPLNNWSMDNCTDVGGMFLGATSFNSSLSGWNLSSCVTTDNMFNSAIAFNQNINNWTLGTTNCYRMFRYATSFNQPLNNWDVSNVKNMEYMFENATSFNQPLNNWNLSNVIWMKHMFSGATSFNSSLSGWNLSSCTDMSSVFVNATAFNQPINDWTLNTTTNFFTDGMFQNATSFNQPLNNWDMSKCTSTWGMFENATSFNQPLNNWNMASCTRMPYFVSGADLGTTAYDATLIGWNNNKLIAANGVANWATNIVVDFGNSRYTAGGAAATARAGLVSYGWTISDGGSI